MQQGAKKFMINLIEKFMELDTIEDEFNENCDEINDDMKCIKGDLNKLIKQFKSTIKKINKTIKLGDELINDECDISSDIRIKQYKLNNYDIILNYLTDTMNKIKELKL
jgi:hypothetical protein